ncbi:LysR family transcriptional regulator [Sorangium sp. So ce448]|uniref:LysR family transcriptional regulator n=1 Tax=Sorangium sp. So ce448 TaxID=3133314 RepID=UPI003F644E45
MFDFDAMATFVEVVQLASFSAAAKALRLPRSTVSERVARLEASLGVRLTERTTRVVRPTSAGAAYHERCARILSEMEEANAAVKDLESSPRGVLRVATPLLFGESFLAGVAAAFTQRHPAVEIEMVARPGDRADPVPDHVWEEAARHHDGPALAAPTLHIALTNLFNRVNVTTRQIAGSVKWKARANAR